MLDTKLWLVFRTHVQNSTDVTTVPNTCKYINNRSSVEAPQMCLMNLTMSKFKIGKA